MENDIFGKEDFPFPFLSIPSSNFSTVLSVNYLSVKAPLPFISFLLLFHMHLKFKHLSIISVSFPLTMCSAPLGCIFSFSKILKSCPELLTIRPAQSPQNRPAQIFVSLSDKPDGRTDWLKDNQGKRIIVCQLDALPHICTNTCMNTEEWVGQEKEQSAEVELLKSTLLLLQKCMWNHSINVLF